MRPSSEIVLASLLPGIRDLRAPLAAGYLWILGAWVLLHDRLPDRDDATGAIDALYALDDATTAVGLGIALSFVAYIVGSLSQTASESIVRAHERFTSLVEAHRVDYGNWRHVFAPSLSEPTRQALMSRARDVIRAVNDKIGHDDNWWYVNARNLGSTSLLTHWLSNWEYTMALDGPLKWEGTEYRLGQPLSDVLRGFTERPYVYAAKTFDSLDGETSRDPRVWAMTDETILRGLTAELPLVLRRLIGIEPEVFSAVDRVQSEAEFRFAIAVPLLFVLPIIVFSLGLPLWIALLLFLAAFVLTIAIYLQGVSRRRLANDSLVDFTRIERVELPSLERIQRRAGIDVGVPQVESEDSKPANASKPRASGSRKADRK